MANEVSKIKLPNDTTEYPLQDDQAIASITRSGTTFTATRRDGTSFTFTQQDNNTTYTFATGDNNGQIKVTPSGGTAQNVSVKGLGAAAYKGTTTSVTSGSSDLVTSGAVYTAIDNLPEPMIFKGSLGTGGTITTLPTASSANEGYTYKVITAGTYASQSAKVGDLFISNGTDWIWIPSGDEPSGTVTSITLKATSPIAIDSSSAITTSGTRTLSHANSGVTVGTYKSVTVNATGHVTSGTNPTTLSGYGITDAKIANGVITLGSNTITPLTSHQTVTDNNPTLAWGTKSKVATIGGTAINVTMPSNPNTDTKVTAVGNHYTPAEDSAAQLDADASSTTAATWNSTSLVTGVTVKRDAKGHVTGIAVDSIKMPANPNTNTTYTIGTSGNNITLTPSSGSVQSITAPYATDAGYLRDSVTATAKLRYINSNDATTWTADTLAATDSIAVIRNSVTGAWATGHIVTFNVNTVGTPFQIGVHDSSELYFYKRYKSSGTYGDWVKMNAGYADSAGSATKATQDGSGNTITSTYVKKSGDTMTGDLILYKEGTTTNNHPSSLIFSNKDTTTGQTYSNAYIKVYQDHGSTTYGTNMVIHTGGGLFLGSGESPASHYSAKGASYSGEDTFLTADGTAHLQANGNTIANRVGVQITTGHALVPEKADVATNNIGSIGTSSYKWANGYFTNINGVAVGDSPKFTDTTYTFTNKNATLAWSTTSTIATVGGVDIKVTMPANPNTNTDTLVTQTNTTTNADYRVLFSENANDTTETKTARKSTNLKYNPSTGNLQTTQLNGVAVGSSPKFTDTNTHRPIQMNGTEILGNNTTVLNLKAGSNVTLSHSSGTVTIAATNTNTHRPIQVDGTEILGNNTTALNLKAGNNVTITHDGGAVTIASSYTNTDVNVKVNNTNPTTGTWYYPVWYTGTSGTGNVNANDGFRYHSLQGTASAVGTAYLQLGNSTSSGTAGNKKGILRLYAEKAGHADIVYTASATGNATHTFPTTGGTILNTGTTSFTQSLSSGTKIGTIKINGTSTDLYCQTNTNNAVTQTIDNSTNSDFRLLMSATSDDTTRTEGAKKTTGLRYNPYDQQLQLLADSSSREDVFEVLYKSPDGVGYIVSARIDADGSATFNKLNLGGSIIPGSTSYHLGSESEKWGDLYVTSIKGGTAYNTQYHDATTNTTGFCMHGRTNGNKYSCIWSSSKLNFYVDTTNVGNVSDRQLKSEIDEVDPKLMEAIAECKIYQYKAFNRDGLISVGIMAQDLVEKCEEKGVRPENYELLTKMNFIQGDDTLYYSVDYNQYATFMINYLQKKVKELEEKIK